MKSTADVVIVGGGCMGCSAAWHLAKRGITNVVLLEREPQLATGSTGKNAGGVRHQFSHPANIELSKESIAMIANFEEIVGTPIDFHQDGYLFLLSRSASVDAFRKNVALQQRHGIDVRWVSNDEARELSPGLDLTGVKGATYCPQDGVADPNGVTMGFARGAQAMGVEIVRECEVTGARLQGNRVTQVRTSKGDIATPILINAAGPWAKSIGRLLGVDVPVEPERRHIFIASAPGGGSWDEPRHAGQVPKSKILVIDFESTFYFHREGGGLLFGMGDPDERAGFDITVRWDFLPKVIEVAIQRLPALADAAVSHAWAGLYEMTPDHNPIIGPSLDVDGFYTIAGFSGHGFQHAPAAGRILADMIAGRDPKFDLTPFALDRFSSRVGAGEGNVV
ncbi:MAG TPA: FAD-binding oxidoreductase [Vicinamibacterales bacterium]|nr:FAD-binding oxidoreductase [Vicinamibacterales bacterium]